MTLDNGEILNSKTKIKTGLSTNNFKHPEGADNVYIIKSKEAHGGKFAKGIISINYAQGRNRIFKPLIVAEGFDPGIITTPENPFGVSDIDDFFAEITQSNSQLTNQLGNINSQE